MTMRKVMVSLGGLVLTAILTILSPQAVDAKEVDAKEVDVKEIDAKEADAKEVDVKEADVKEAEAEEFDLTDPTQWEDKLMADVEISMNIRKSATRLSAVIGTLKKGEIAEILKEEEDWTLIRIGDVEGYVSDEYTVCRDAAYELAMELGQNVVKALIDELPLYESPDETAEVAATVPEETLLLPAEESEETEAAETTEEAEAAEATEVAEEAAVSVREDTEVVEAAEGWIAVRYGDQTCYVKEEDVKICFEIDPVGTVAGIYSCSEEDVELFAALLWCEAGGTSYEGLLGVASVVMNRIENEYFADTLRGVIYEKGQFTPAMTGQLQRVLSSGEVGEDAYAAARAALNGARNTDCLYFQSARHGHYGQLIGGNVFF